MKGVVFTLDALFALMIAAAGITVILYFVYSAPTPAVIQYSSSSALVGEMSSTKLSAITGIPLVQRIVNQSVAYNQSWPQIFQNAAHSGGNPYGPYLYDVIYTVNAPYNIQNGSLSAGYGNVYFGAGNVVYAINATTGRTVWTSASPFNSIYYLWRGSGGWLYQCQIPDTVLCTPSVNATAVYDGMLIYATIAGTYALNAYNGTPVWSSAIPYVQPGHNDGPPTFNPWEGEPDGDEISRRITMYDGEIITGAGEPISGNDGSPLFAYYASNGSIVGQSTSYPATGGAAGPAMLLPVIVDGQIFTTIARSINCGGFCRIPLYLSANLFTPIYNSSSAAAGIWGDALTNAEGVSNPATYGNVIVVGEGTDADIYSINGVIISSTTISSGLVSGVSSYNGHIIFQGGVGGTSGSVYSFSSLGNILWEVTSPSSFGSTLYNETPLQSSHNIYTIWGNGYLGIQNLSTGVFTQSVKLPFYGNVDPYPILAYGRLYASIGSHIVAFGTCQADLNSSTIAAIATMYLNDQGSCADYVLNSLQNMENSTFTLNNKSIITVASFSGQAGSNIIIPYSSQLALSGPQTVSLWFKSNCASVCASFTSTLLTSNPNINNLGITLKGGGRSANVITVKMGSGLTALVSSSNTINGFTPNTWYNLVAVFTNSGCSIYINGQNVTIGASKCTYAGTPQLLSSGSVLEMGSAGATSGFTGSIADVQIYSSALSFPQVRQIYLDGLSTGPPVSSTVLTWFPLAGDANGYGTVDFPGFPFGVTFNDTSYNSTGLANSYSIASQSVPVILENYTTGSFNIYNAGVYSWG